MISATLTVELFTEELPPRALARLSTAFADAVAGGLRQRGFLSGQSTCDPYATPRRLAVTITHVRARSPDQPMKQKLMPSSVALDASGKPTIALVKKLESLGRGALADAWPETSVGADRWSRESDGKAEAVFLHSIARGSPLQNGLQAALDDALEKLPIPKVMSYARPGSYWNDTKFVRPVHALLALHGSEVVRISAVGLDAGATTDGHRFLSRKGIEIGSADAYAETLAAEGKIVAGFAERRAKIVDGLRRAAGADTPIMPDALLDEVTALVEWPAVYAGAFDAAFLDVPAECLILTMQQNQKYFALKGRDQRLVNRFLLVSNIETADPSAIVHGNERVLRARLADAKFFFDQDRRTPLARRVDRLRNVVYHNQLGSQHDRVERLRVIARAIAEAIGASVEQADRAAYLAKADLVTDMVGEFPELQGLMGRYYAEHDGERSDVAAAIEQHYSPRFAGDALPGTGVAQAVALADRLETLAAHFGLGNEPTGDKDPFGLRRAALGVIRIVVEQRLALSLPTLASLAFDAFESVKAVKPAREALESFVYDRLRGYLREQGYTANQIAAVVDARPADIHLVPAKLAAVQAFEALPEAAALAAANKRIVNILRKSGEEASASVDPTRFADGAERDLHAAFATLGPDVDARCERGDYTGALKALATTKPVVDRFFDDVMVMTDDDAIRANRLSLLTGVARTMNRVADISKLAT
jgi:glycyl-tRNA synthetase beta chain